MIVIGTKLKNSITVGDKVNFFNKTKGIIRDNQVTKLVAKMVQRIKLIVGMF